MKIHIELEVAPDEVPLAAELFAVLRSLTEHVSVRSSQPPPPLHHGEVAQVQPPMPASATFAPAPLPLPVAPPPQVGQPPPAGGLKSVFKDLIASSIYAEHPEQVAGQLESLAWEPSSALPPAQRKKHPAFSTFAEAWEEVALNADAQGATAAPYAVFLANLSPAFRDAVRDAVIPHILTHLTQKRALDAPRTDFFGHAEAFAAMVSIGMMPMQGAISSICGLIKDPTKRAAAVTVLGKTVELCGFMIADKVSPEVLKTLQDTVNTITEEPFAYDVAYIKDIMGWAVAPPPLPPPPPPQSPPPPQPPQHIPGGDAAFTSCGGAPHALPPPPQPSRSWRLTPLASLPAHNEHIFAVAVDPARRQLVTGGKDPFLRVWTEEGQPVQTLDLGGKYVASLDYHPRLSMLLAATLDPQAQAAPPGAPLPFVVAGYSAAEPNGFSLKGAVARDIQCTCIKAMPGAAGFLTGELHNSAAAIRYWDIGAAPSFGSLQPSATFTGHQDVVFSLLALPDPALFVSCAKDGGVFLWDMRRGPHRVAAVGEAAHGAPFPRAAAAPHMVTCLEASDQLLLTGATDRTVKLWDMRMASGGRPVAPLSSVVTQGQVVMKLAALPGTRTVAVSAMNALYTLDFTNEAAPTLAPVEAAWQDGRRDPVTYHDIKWNSSGTALFAVGKSASLDVYARV